MIAANTRHRRFWTKSTVTDCLGRPSIRSCPLCCWRVFTAIKSSPDLTAKFLSAASHRILFCKIMDSDTLLVEDNYCFNWHDLKTLVVRHFFNCIAKNLVPVSTFLHDTVWKHKCPLTMKEQCFQADWEDIAQCGACSCRSIICVYHTWQFDWY